MQSDSFRIMNINLLGEVLAKYTVGNVILLHFFHIIYPLLVVTLVVVISFVKFYPFILHNYVIKSFTCYLIVNINLHKLICNC